jgi:hypothetical protein
MLLKSAFRLVLVTLIALTTVSALSMAAEHFPLDINQCTGSPHMETLYKRYGSVQIIGANGAIGDVCTKPISKNVKITRATCEVYSSSSHPDVGGSKPCGVGQNCPYASTEDFWMVYTPSGDRQYCWRVKNSADHQRDFSISVAE